MYHVEFTPNAEADVARLSAPMAQQVLKRLVWLAENFRPGSAWLLGLCTRKSPWEFQSKMATLAQILTMPALLHATSVLLLRMWSC